MRTFITLCIIFSIYIIHDTYLVLLFWYQFLSIMKLKLRQKKNPCLNKKRCLEIKINIIQQDDTCRPRGKITSSPLPPLSPISYLTLTPACNLSDLDFLQLLYHIYTRACPGSTMPCLHAHFCQQWNQKQTKNTPFSSCDIEEIQGDWCN